MGREPRPQDVWKNRDGINDDHFSQLFLLLGEGGIGESYAVEKVVLSTLYSNWLLSLPLYTTGYTKQGVTPGPGISTEHPQMSSTLLRQLKRCHRQTELFNQLASEIVPLKPRTQLNYLDHNEKIRWEAP